MSLSHGINYIGSVPSLITYLGYGLSKIYIYYQKIIYKISRKFELLIPL